MGVVYQWTKLSVLASEPSLRADFKYIVSLPKEEVPFYRFKEIADFVSYSAINLDESETFLYAEIGDVSKNGEVNPVELSFLERNEENENLFKKIEKGDIIKPQKGDILISKIRPYLNKNVLVGEEQIYYTKAFIQIRPRINAEIFYFALRTIFYTQLNAVSRQGKGYPTLKEEDLKSIKFSKQVIDSFIEKENEILSEIEPIEAEISRLKNRKLKPLDIINKVFGEEFGFDWEFYKEFGKGMTAGTQQSNVKEKLIYQFPFSQIAKSNIFRFSCRFHNPKTQFLNKILFSKPTIKIKNVVSEKVHRGISPDYDSNGEIPVVKTAHLKNGYLDISQEEFVKEEFYAKNSRAQIQRNDVLVASTGKVSLGKIDIVETDQNLVIDGHISVIRLNETKYNPLFLTYFLRSILGTFQIERDYTGSTNQIELYSAEIEYFDIPDFSLAKQAEMVEKIKTQIDAQNLIDQQIEQKQQEISAIIEKAIK